MGILFIGIAEQIDNIYTVRPAAKPTIILSLFQLQFLRVHQFNNLT